MEKTLTIRLNNEQHEALRGAARQQGRTVSELVRDTLQKALMERPVAAKVGHLKGRLTLKRSLKDSWRRAIKQRNWRP
jgi:Family of unknown function (DUF6364)